MTQASDICAAVAHKYGIDPSCLNKGTASAKHYYQARGEAMAAIRQHLKWSYPRIGIYFGGYHHTSVMNLMKRWGCSTDPMVILPKPTMRALQDRIEFLAARVNQLEKIVVEFGLLRNAA